MAVLLDCYLYRYTARLTLLVRFDDSVQSAPKREHLAWAAAAVSELPD